MTPKTLRRKLQKKKKHKPYIKCPKCGDRAKGRVVDNVVGVRLKYQAISSEPTLIYRCWNRQCKHEWCKGLGGETADTYGTRKRYPKG